LYDPARPGSYLPPVQRWALHEEGTVNNTKDMLLPSKLLLKEMIKLNGGDMKIPITKMQCKDVAANIKDSSMTEQVVFNWFTKQRLIHLRRLIGAA
jgi:hypothetical protein